MKTYDMGTFFEDRAEAGCPTVTHLGRPFDIAADGGLLYGVDELAHLVKSGAGWLSAAGAGARDRVAIIKDNHFDIDLLACAAIRVGAVPALIPARLAPATHQTMLARVEPRVLITTADVLEAAAAGGVDLTAMAKQVVTIDRSAAGAIVLADLKGSPTPAPYRRGINEPLVINPTSGTTGIPKLVIHSTATIIKRLAAFEAHRWPLIGGRPDDTVASASAFTHGRTFCWTAVAYTLGPRKVVIVDDHDPAVAGPLLCAYPPTVVEALPSTYVQWQPMAAGARNPFHNVRMFIGTYDAIHPPTVRTFLSASGRRGAIWMQGWGQTELGPLAFRYLTRRSMAPQALRHPTTRNQGRPIPSRAQLRVVDPVTFARLPAGQQGLVLARTRARCLGYLGEQSRFTAKTQGSWFNTGDLGIKTRSGSITFLDREVDAVPGMSCLELEDVIEDRMAQVIECVIIGTPDQLPLPVVVTSDGTLDLTAWEQAVSDLPPLAPPHAQRWEQLPRTSTGKVRRLQLRTMLDDRLATHGTGRWT